MRSEDDSQELKVDLAEKSARQRPLSNQWQPTDTTTTRSEHRRVPPGGLGYTYYKFKSLEGKLEIGKCRCDRFSLEGSRYEPCHFKVKLVSFDFVKGWIACKRWSICFS